MFDDIDLSVGEVLPSTSLDQTAMFPTTSDLCSCNSQCCHTSKVCC